MAAPAPCFTPRHLSMRGGFVRNLRRSANCARCMSSYSQAEVPQSITLFLRGPEKSHLKSSNSCEIKSNSCEIKSNSCGNPVNSLPNTILPVGAFKSYTAKHTNALLFFKSLDKVPIHARQNVLSHNPLDIRGVDTSAFLTSISRTRKGEGYPTLIRNEFFILKFVPPGHDILRYRKSNIAYIVTYRGGCKLNSKLLQTALDNYRGKYRLHAFFSKVYEPLGCAFGRVRNRRLLKKCLFESLHKHANLPQQVKQVLGLFIFNSSFVPRTADDFKVIRADIDRAVRQVLSGRMKQPQPLPKVDTQAIMKLMRRNASLGKIKFPGQAPRLPFFRS